MFARLAATEAYAIGETTPKTISRLLLDSFNVLYRTIQRLLLIVPLQPQNS